MKALAILFRLVFSILVLLATACYLQVSPTISLEQFYSSLDPAALVDQLCGLNALTISLALVVVLTICSFTRLLDAIWNMAFCAAIILLLGVGLYTFCGPAVALPNALYHNSEINSICSSVAGYEVPIAITLFIFVTGWFCASACGRVAITSLLSFGLWYGITEVFTYATHLWGRSADPALPEALYMIQGSPWILAAVPGAFFLIYALLMAFFETYISSRRSKAVEESSGEDNASASAPIENKSSEEVKKAAGAESATKSPAAATKAKPVLKTAAPAPAKTLKLATPAVETTVEPKVEAPRTEEPVASELQPAENKEETTTAYTPAENDTANTPPAEVEKSSPEQPESDEKSAEHPVNASDKPVEEKKADEPAAEDTPKDKTPA